MRTLILSKVAIFTFLFTGVQLCAQTEAEQKIDSLASTNTMKPDTVQMDSVVTAATDSPMEKPWRFGLGFGLNFVGGTNISLAPNLNYFVSDKVSFGAGLQFNFISIKDVQRTTTFGGNAIVQYLPVRQLTTLVEFSQLNVSTKRETDTGDIEDDFWESALFIGAGLNITNKISAGVKYNLLYDDDESVYTSPILPFVNIGF